MDFFETEYEVVVQGEDGLLYLLTEHDDGQIYAVPVEPNAPPAAPADPNEALFNSFLSMRGYDDPDTAPDSAMEAAADEMVAWAAKAEQALTPAEPTSLDLINDMMDERGFSSADAEDLVPLLDRSIEAIEAGTMPARDAFNLAGDALVGWRAKMAEKAKANSYRRPSADPRAWEDGLGDALSDWATESKAARAADTPSQPGSTAAGNQNLGRSQRAIGDELASAARDLQTQVAADHASDAIAEQEAIARGNHD